MMTSRLKETLLLGLVVSSVLLAGCGTTALVGNKPEDRLNPALSAHQKSVLSARMQQSGN